MLPGHTCNAYCRQPYEHCEQLRTTPGASRDAIWQALATRGLWVIDAVPAREPMGWERATILAGPRVAAHAATEPWLVTWREDYLTARAEYDAGTLPRWRSALDD